MARFTVPNHTIFTNGNSSPPSSACLSVPHWRISDALQPDVLHCCAKHHLTFCGWETPNHHVLSFRKYLGHI